MARELFTADFIQDVVAHVGRDRDIWENALLVPVVNHDAPVVDGVKAFGLREASLFLPGDSTLFVSVAPVPVSGFLWHIESECDLFHDARQCCWQHDDPHAN